MDRAERIRDRVRLATLVVMSFAAFECLLLAATLREHWLALAIPGVVCAARAHTVFREASVAPAHSASNESGNGRTCPARSMQASVVAPSASTRPSRRNSYT